jgi:hypothetical protein
MESNVFFLFESVRIREYAPVTTERRAGDVGKFKISKLSIFGPTGFIGNRSDNVWTGVRESEKKGGARPKRLTFSFLLV